MSRQQGDEKQDTERSTNTRRHALCLIVYKQGMGGNQSRDSLVHEEKSRKDNTNGQDV